MKAYQFASTNCHIMRQTGMDDENTSSNITGSNLRITRARAKALGSLGGLPPLHPSAKQGGKRVLPTNSKRSASYDKQNASSSAACPQQKKRAILKDITNITCNNLYTNCISATAGQTSNLESKSSRQNIGKMVTACFSKEFQVPGYKTKEFQVPGYKRRNVTEKINIPKVEETQKIGPTVNLAIEPTEAVDDKMSSTAVLIPLDTMPTRNTPLLTPYNRQNVKLLSSKQENLGDRGITDIDSEKHPLMCSMYAADIYSNLRAIQIYRRPAVYYMEKLQHDVTEAMRGILVDWLVEVSEEYRLIPDTLYLTVNLIDRFLSAINIEKQKLQLLGVTCMLIASKYEEICAPCVEEFCFITDNTYTKGEVLKMEGRVLNYLGFQLSIPTTKKFLRRFIHAAQVSYEIPSVELEFLANYLAELTLIEYSFLKFLPSLIAASAVFLARWTIDQSDHPWNPTLEYYTMYKTSDLKHTVLELHDLQLNTKTCKLNAIREKYKQSKFKCVSTLRPEKPVQSLF
ncbi:cyclin-A2-1-like [Henckelia pumila]|uniref:cyclin-A2-1-like n=1 Tax=Henckelia pumila TaxID=405737 RepID=UPI003C6E1F53